MAQFLALLTMPEWKRMTIGKNTGELAQVGSAEMATNPANPFHYKLFIYFPNHYHHFAPPLTLRHPCPLHAFMLNAIYCLH